MTLFDTPKLGELLIVVHGNAKPAGSKRAFIRGKRAIVVDANPNSRPWKDQVAAFAIEAMNGLPLLQGPLAVEMRFYQPRPASHRGRTGLNAHGRRTPRPTTRPDLLKLARGCEDALTGITYQDDSQIVSELLEKHYGDPPRVEIRIRQLAPEGGTA